NLLGPLANPAGVRRQLVGVFSPAWVEPLAQAFAQLGSDRAMVVHGDGYDELAVSGDSGFVLAADGTVTTGQISAADAGVGRHDAAALAGGDAAHNAARLRALLHGETGAYHDIVVLNAAAALTIADANLPLRIAADRARAALASGAALDTLDRWSAFQ
ncbi:MAG: bifunctional anthranilate synthase component II/anthranilate phosphoribosyltransferase, partial [Sandarakinorhabdus sp.]|nr:bifunctional anthranilate synthase component II/anthranilate phosphoribosyltransferase [Sandarakinorhabdus sp.]